jgi:hypothetical protein
VFEDRLSDEGRNGIGARKYCNHEFESPDCKLVAIQPHHWKSVWRLSRFTGPAPYNCTYNDYYKNSERRAQALSTAWMAVSELAPQPVAFYAAVFFLGNATYICLIYELIDSAPMDDVLYQIPLIRTRGPIGAARWT